MVNGVLLQGQSNSTDAEAIERRLREQVAACMLLSDLGIPGYSGHVSARLPGRDA